jgi:hypothetical protein
MEKLEKDKESLTGERNQVKLLWFQTGGALNFKTAAPHCGGQVWFRVGAGGTAVTNGRTINKVSLLFQT